MKTKKVYPCVPPGCVEIKLPRVIFPKEVTQPLANANDNPWHSVDEWSLVVCPSDMTVRVGTENFGDHYEYSAIWSLLSGKVYEWGDYYTHGPAPKSREVGCVDVLISCIPNKDHCEPPEKVYLYTTTQGVVRIVERVFDESTRLVRLMPNLPAISVVPNEPFPQSLTVLEDSPFGVYSDLVEDSNLCETNKSFVKLLLSVFFGQSDASILLPPNV